MEENPDFGTPDELITTTVDCSAVAGRKYASLAAHASQSENIFFLQMGEELFSSIMGSESFVRAVDTTQGAGPRGRPLRRAALIAEPEAGPAPQPGERDAGPVRNGPYVAVPAGVEPGRASGTDPTRQSRRRA